PDVCPPRGLSSPSYRHTEPVREILEKKRKAGPGGRARSISTLYFQNSKLRLFIRQNSKLYSPSLSKHLNPIAWFLPIDKISSYPEIEPFHARPSTLEVFLRDP